MPHPAIQPTITRYALLVALALVVCAAATLVVAYSTSASWPTALTLAAIATAISSIALAPALIPSPGHFGLGVVAASGARAILLIAAGLALAKLADMPPRAVWFSILTSGGLMLAAETALSVRTLLALERIRSAPQPQESTAPC